MRRKGFKRAWSEITEELKLTAFRMQAGDTSVITKTDRILAFVVTFLFFGLFVFTTAHAGGDLFQTIGNKFGDSYTNFVGIATITAALCILVGLLWTMLSPSSKSSATPISWIKKVLFCYFLIMILGGILKVIDSIAEGQGYGDQY